MGLNCSGHARARALLGRERLRRARVDTKPGYTALCTELVELLLCSQRWA